MMFTKWCCSCSCSSSTTTAPPSPSHHTTSHFMTPTSLFQAPPLTIPEIVSFYLSTYPTIIIKREYYTS